MSMDRDLLFIQKNAPHGNIFGQEVLDACLMGSAFARCALLFLGDGIFQILKNQDTKALAVKNYSVSYGVLADYGVEQVFCLQSDLTARNLRPEDLVVDVTVIDNASLSNLVRRSGQVMSF